MLHLKRGVTLVEVLIAALICVALAGLLLPTLSQGKEGSRQTECVHNLKQVYAALLSYASDFDYAQNLASMKVLPNRLWPYASSREVFYCPDFPNYLKEKSRLSSSYEWRFMSAPRENETNREDHKRLNENLYESQKKQYDKLGGNYPLAVCFIHDELFYLPKERHLDHKLVGAYVIELRENGSVYKGRMHYPRGKQIKLLQDILGTKSER